jgi:DNA-3-methyladenine glycosylase II
MSQGYLPAYWKDGCDFLVKVDPVMRKLIDGNEDSGLRAKNSAFLTLARAVVGQQVSVASADAVWLRLQKLLNNNMSAENLLKFSNEQIHSCGIPKTKTQYLKNVADCIINDFNGKVCLRELDNDEVGKKLIAVKGIGPWTVEMFMIFHMQAEDEFPLGDIGLINAMKICYGLPKIRDGQTKREYNIAMVNECAKIGENLKPYRTIATWYLWRVIDPVVVEY